MAIDDPSSTQPEHSLKPTPLKTRKKRPNYAQIHSRPLPVVAHPLPAFHPSHPISLLRLCYAFVSHLLFPPASHPPEPYFGFFSPDTRSVHVTDSKHVRALWEMGFFGKGSLSRSEPTWLERETERLNGVVATSAAEDATAKRRDERRLFKLERARLEREEIEKQRALERGNLDSLETELSGQGLPHATLESGKVDISASSKERDANVPGTAISPLVTEPARSCNRATRDGAVYRGDAQTGHDIQNQEHLQLTFEETFFLTYGLGVLSISPPPTAPQEPVAHRTHPYSNRELLALFSRHSHFPPADPSASVAADDPFLLNYVVYHHFRSLGWVVRPGVKFGVDYLLYHRGPVFSHAEFAVLIMPTYTHRFWSTPSGRARRRLGPGIESGDGQKDWWWLHCVNRVQSQVRKTLVLCYVDIPSPCETGLDDKVDEEIDVGRLLRGYHVREFVVRRWVGNRMRD